VGKFIVSTYGILANSIKMSQTTFYDFIMYTCFSETTIELLPSLLKLKPPIIKI